MQKSTYYVLGLVGLIVVLTMLFFLKSPEFEVAVSDDGMVMVEGVTWGSKPFSVHGVGEDVYEVHPMGVALEDSARVTFFSDVHEMGVFWRDADFSILWHEVETALGTAEGQFVVDARELGSYRLLMPVEVSGDLTMPFDVFRDFVPEDAVGFRMAVGYLAEDGVYRALDWMHQTGGCGGVIQRGREEVYSEVEVVAPFFVEGELVNVDIVYLVEWYVDASGEGCGEAAFEVFGGVVE